jgi:hypothetical protein
VKGLVSAAGFLHVPAIVPENFRNKASHVLFVVNNESIREMFHR